VHPGHGVGNLGVPGRVPVDAPILVHASQHFAGVHVDDHPIGDPQGDRRCDHRPGLPVPFQGREKVPDARSVTMVVLEERDNVPGLEDGPQSSPPEENPPSWFRLGTQGETMEGPQTLGVPGAGDHVCVVHDPGCLEDGPAGSVSVLGGDPAVQEDVQVDS